MRVSARSQRIVNVRSDKTAARSMLPLALRRSEISPKLILPPAFPRLGQAFAQVLQQTGRVEAWGSDLIIRDELTRRLCARLQTPVFEKFSGRPLPFWDDALVFHPDRRDQKEIAYPEYLDGLRDFRGTFTGVRISDGDGVFSKCMTFGRQFYQWSEQRLGKRYIRVGMPLMAKMVTRDPNFMHYNMLALKQHFGRPLEDIKKEARWFVDQAVLDPAFNQEPGGSRPAPCLSHASLERLASEGEKGMLTVLISGSQRFIWEAIFERIEEYSSNILRDAALAKRLQKRKFFIMGMEHEVQAKQRAFANGDAVRPLSMSTGKLFLAVEALKRLVGDPRDVPALARQVHVITDCETDTPILCLGNPTTRTLVDPSPVVDGWARQSEADGLFSVTHQDGHEELFAQGPRRYLEYVEMMKKHRCDVVVRKAREFKP